MLKKVVIFLGRQFLISASTTKKASYDECTPFHSCMHTSFNNRAYFFYETIVCAVPGVPLTNFIWMEGEGWGATEVHILYPPKITTFF